MFLFQGLFHLAFCFWVSMWGKNPKALNRGKTLLQCHKNRLAQHLNLFPHLVLLARFQVTCFSFLFISMKFPSVSSLYKHQIKDTGEVHELNSTAQENCDSSLTTLEGCRNRVWNLEPKIWSSGQVWPSKVPVVFRTMPVSFLTFPKSNKTLYERIWCRAPSTLLNTQKSPKHNVLQTNQLQRFFLFYKLFFNSLFPLSPGWPVS